jgi:hypothetical protein
LAKRAAKSRGEIAVRGGRQKGFAGTLALFHFWRAPTAAAPVIISSRLVESAHD